VSVPPNTPWFAGHDGRLLVYRVNRRPRFEESLFPTTPPPGVFGHFKRMLAPGFEVHTGRKNQRVWRVGGLAIDDESQLITGKLGWQPVEEELVAEWSDEEKDWVTRTAATRERKLMPFGFDGDSRILTVLGDNESAPATIAAVFEKILRENEAELEEPTTEWSVEPILDRGDFLSWLRSAEVVTSVSFTAKLPNPEPTPEYDDLFDRLKNAHATHHTETMRSTKDEGLIEVDKDPDFAQAIVMGQQGFATLRGRGRRGGKVTKYSQKETVASEPVEDLPPTWPEMRDMLGGYLKGQLRKFKEDRSV
jgi:hypothetical protein